jgi:hypothetical protein
MHASLMQLTAALGCIIDKGLTPIVTSFSTTKISPATLVAGSV